MSESSKGKFSYEYPRPAVTVDVVIVTKEATPQVLLIRRKHNPFEGKWAIPGGFVDDRERLEDAARRELREETGVQTSEIEQIGAFGDPGRDPRGWTISVAFLAQIPPGSVNAVAADDAAEVGWHRLDQPPELAFDHDKILARAREVLES